MFDLSFDKLLVIGAVALFVIGPQRLPYYAAQLGKLVRTLRGVTDAAKTRIRDEIGEDVDWTKIDPRQYDPRRIIRDALTDDGELPDPSTLDAATRRRDLAHIAADERPATPEERRAAWDPEST